jgi:phosphoribosylamine---glycine ligase
VFGPNRQAAQLEASKSFAAAFMQRHDIPMPESWEVTNMGQARSVLQDRSPDSYVIKADGLAGGKGVVLPATQEEAEAVLQAMFDGTGFEGAGKHMVVIQERLHGPEVSAFALSDGANFVMLPFTQDHKRLLDNDQGPNTGGMGAYCPVPNSIVGPSQAEKIRDIARRTIEGMQAEGEPYKGVLYLGVMLAEERGGDPAVIEYNARFGDPETEVLLAALQASGCDVAKLLIETAKGNLANIKLPERTTAAALTVCLAAPGYPNQIKRDMPINGLEKNYPNVVVQHGATLTDSEGCTVVNGGRVLYVTGTGATADEAAEHAYAAIGPHAINFEGMQYRTDIGHQARTNLSPVPAPQAPAASATNNLQPPA